MRIFLFIAVAALVIACVAWGSRAVFAKARLTEPVEHAISGASDAEARRNRSNAILRGQGVPILASLPVIESEREVILPSQEEVTMRAVATLVVALKGEGLEQNDIDRLVARYDLTKWLSPDEAAFIADPRPSERDRLVHSWRYEAANTLLWTLSLVEHLGPPRSPCDPAALASLLKKYSRSELLAKAKLRPTAEILDEADLIYRYRWALVDAGDNKRPPPAGLSDDVAMERHQALNWIIYHAEQPWDEITLDT